MKKKKIKITLIIIGMIVFQSLIYFITKLVQGEPYLLKSTLDDSLPFISWFVYFYILWYPMLFFIPYILYAKNKDIFYKYMSIYIISVIICGIIFMLFPTTIVRQEIVGKDFTSKLVNLIYSMDLPPVNCLPSIHCLVSYMFMYGICNVNVKNEVKAFVCVLASCIVISTLLIKQHVIYDAVASLAVCTTAIYLTNKFGLWKRFKKYFG